MNICSSIRVPTMLALTAIVSVLLFSPISYNSAWAQSADVVEPSAPEVDPEAVPDAEEIRGLILAAVPNSISDGGTVSLLAGVSNGTNIQWTWNFGDGSGLTDSGTDKSNLQEHTFNLSNPSVSQTFVVSVNASNENNPRGVTATATVNVRVKAPANLSVTYAPDPPAAQQPIQFVAQVESKANVTYKWEFGDGTVIMGGPVVSHVYATQGIFKVKVTATNAGGAVTHEKRQ